MESQLVGNSPLMEQLRGEIRVYADTPASVLICGPSGCGKEVVASALHRLSSRRDKPFVAINCGAIPADLLEAELFGHEKGAFTGAIAMRRGRFEEASGGTLFLDEIGDMPLAMQVKLLRVLEDGYIQRVGGPGRIAVNVRIIAATHRDIDAAIHEGRFREDLFYRIAVLPIVVPALAERIDDIADLTAHFARTLPSRGKVRFSERAIARLAAHDWPGNVRELRNVVQRAMILYSGSTIDATQIDGLLCTRGGASDPQATYHSVAPIRFAPPQAIAACDLEHEDGPLDLTELVNVFERRCIMRAIERAGGNVSEAARLLSIQRTTLIGKLQKHAITANAA
ncbi:MAG: sigma-54 dependent transcriptional regulator [Sphingopyxis sp.]